MLMMLFTEQRYPHLICLEVLPPLLAVRSSDAPWGDSAVCTEDTVMCYLTTDWLASGQPLHRRRN
jgi:hypothetical protein